MISSLLFNYHYDDDDEKYIVFQGFMSQNKTKCTIRLFPRFDLLWSFLQEAFSCNHRCEQLGLKEVQLAKFLWVL